MPAVSQVSVRRMIRRSELRVRVVVAASRSAFFRLHAEEIRPFRPPRDQVAATVGRPAPEPREVTMSQPFPAPPTGRSTLVSVAVGLVAAIVAGCVAGAITGLSNYQIGFVAVGIGVIVGFAMARTATPTRALAPIAAALAIAGCLVGDLVADMIFAGKAEEVPFSTVLSATFKHPTLARDLFKAGFEPTTLLFWGIAAFAAFSFVRKAVAELEQRIAQAHQPTGAPEPA
jgi:hypothetical protein